MVKYGRDKFSDRDLVDVSHYSSLVNELTQADYRSIGQIDTDVERATKALALDEKETGNRYSDVGAIRVSIALASKTYRDIAYSGGGGGFTQEMLDLVEA